MKHWGFHRMDQPPKVTQVTQVTHPMLQIRRGITLQIDQQTLALFIVGNGSYSTQQQNATHIMHQVQGSGTLTEFHIISLMTEVLVMLVTEATSASEDCGVCEWPSRLGQWEGGTAPWNILKPPMTVTIYQYLACLIWTLLNGGWDYHGLPWAWFFQMLVCHASRQSMKLCPSLTDSWMWLDYLVQDDHPPFWSISFHGQGRILKASEYLCESMPRRRKKWWNQMGDIGGVWFSGLFHIYSYDYHWLST